MFAKRALAVGASRGSASARLRFKPVIVLRLLERGDHRGEGKNDCSHTTQGKSGETGRSRGSRPAIPGERQKRAKRSENAMLAVRADWDGTPQVQVLGEKGILRDWKDAPFSPPIDEVQ